MNPVFSIITVTYNARQWIENTIQSIIGQTYDNIEFIIIDGKSNDGTIDIIQRYEANIDYWISEPDNGLYDAMNKGIKKAKGDYIWFINAGDKIYDENTAQNIVDKIEDKDTLPDIIYGETTIIDKNGQFVGMRRLKAPEELTWKSFKMGMLVSHQSFIAKREIVPLYDLEYRFSADVDWCIKCLKKSKNIFNSHLVLSQYLEEGLTTANHKASLRERYEIMSHYYGKIPTIIRHLWFAIRFYEAKIRKRKI
jgi:glycosyltransferase involved in cell wall biosynthesis